MCVSWLSAMPRHCWGAGEAGRRGTQGGTKSPDVSTRLPLESGPRMHVYDEGQQDKIVARHGFLVQGGCFCWMRWPCVGHSLISVGQRALTFGSVGR